MLVKEIIKYCEEENVDAALVLMDFEKAFDRVDREAMMSVLESMGFGEDFCSFIRTMYTDVEAQVDVNGKNAESFITGGGVRQGCPLSPFLFLCVLDGK